MDLSGIVERQLKLEECKQKFESRYILPSPAPDKAVPDWLRLGLSGSERAVFDIASSKTGKIARGASEHEDASIREMAYRELVHQFHLTNICGVNSGLSDLEILEDVVFSRALSMGLNEDFVIDERSRRRLIAEMVLRGNPK